VKKAPFVVLIGANMPSILAEISFVTNPEDAEQLQSRSIGARGGEPVQGRGEVCGGDQWGEGSEVRQEKG
jgi:N-acetylmuramoyl-L-alanine amidase